MLYQDIKVQHSIDNLPKCPREGTDAARGATRWPSEEEPSKVAYMPSSLPSAQSLPIAGLSTLQCASLSPCLKASPSVITGRMYQAGAKGTPIMCSKRAKSPGNGAGIRGPRERCAVHPPVSPKGARQTQRVIRPRSLPGAKRLERWRQCPRSGPSFQSWIRLKV